MPNVLKSFTGFSVIATMVAIVLFHCFAADIFLTLAITFGTISYHLGIRLLVGFLYHVGMKNRADYTQKWYQVHPWEIRLYRLLRVKAWKNKMPTYQPQLFSAKDRTWDEIAQAMCQSELVHETNFVLSFVPVMAAKWFGSLDVFLITSFCGGIFDLLFVMIQRYNRARVMQLVLRQR